MSWRANPTERALAVASGEGDITVSPVDVLTPHQDAGRITVLMGAGGTPFPAPWENVPTAESLGIKDDPFNQTRAIGVSPEVSDEHRDWLYSLYSAAAKDPAYAEARQKITALELMDLDPAETKALAMNGYDVSVSIFKDLGIYWEDQ